MRPIRVLLPILAFALVASACADVGDSIGGVADAAADSLEGRRLSGDCPTVPPDLMDYADRRDAIVRMTEEGPIVAKEEFRAIRITVMRNKRLLEVLQGYQGEPIDDRSELLPNDKFAFWDFMAAIDFEGFLSCRGRDANVSEDGVGTCPQDSRMIVELMIDRPGEEPELLHRLWSASCDSGLGTLDGNPREIRELFQEQIPDYGDLVRDIDI